jgi:hypothetical protein
MFQRYADLSIYFARNGTPTELATREFTERIRLQVDIVEQIKRLVAFADIQASQGADTAAKGQREACGQFLTGLRGRRDLCDCCDLPASAHRIAKPEPQYRMLEAGEVIQDGDEVRLAEDLWSPTTRLGSLVDEVGGYSYRRPIPAPVAPEAGLRADFQPREPKAKARSDGGAAKGPEWRLLEIGETIKSGDQFLAHAGDWRYVEVDIDTKAYAKGSHRRLIA